MTMSISANDDSGPIADMNTTPLVDVMLVLLILFIITLPVMTNSTNLHIGQGPIIPTSRETISLAIDFDGTILWNGTVVEDLAQLSVTSWSRPARPGSRSCTCSPTAARSTTRWRRCWRSPSAAACSASASPARNGSRNKGRKENRQYPGVLAARPA